MCGILATTRRWYCAYLGMVKRMMKPKPKDEIYRDYNGYYVDPDGYTHKTLASAVKAMEERVKFAAKVLDDSIKAYADDDEQYTEPAPDLVYCDSCNKAVYRAKTLVTKNGYTYCQDCLAEAKTKEIKAKIKAEIRNIKPPEPPMPQPPSDERALALD